MKVFLLVTPLTSRHHNEPWIPTLRLLHQFPFLLPPQMVDKGAIKFVLSGANIMCPGTSLSPSVTHQRPTAGLTHPNARMTPCEKGTVVAIFAEGKTHPLAIGKTSMSTEDIKTKNKGIGVENYHYLNDGLWHIKHFK